ncbi:hypothetical protein [Nannocystis pusilla]|uniref:Uncharacterized protein n=1 Tax=Nannocystis pusilla TaxID=889268 RepID=A0ABS7U0B0_9BACT|nr:hypothetical protein [Nannocystis pusilla]MBZ5713884.1 hypothetical protein [Nannocystis pusilla]
MLEPAGRRRALLHARATLPDQTPSLCASAPGRPNLLLSHHQSGVLVTVQRRWREFEVTKTSDEEYRVWSEPRRKDWMSYRDEVPWHVVPTVWLPAIEEPAELVDLWLDNQERSAWVDEWSWDQFPRRQALLQSYAEWPIALFDPQDWERQAIEVAAATWDQADAILAQCWMASRAAVREPVAVRLPDGVVFVSLGAGTSARIEMSERRGRYHGEPEGACDAGVHQLVDARRAAAGADSDADLDNRARLSGHDLGPLPAVSSSSPYFAGAFLGERRARARGRSAL